MASTAVRVGLRVRPLTSKEQLSNCTECLTFIPNEPQILLGTDKSFTYDYVFDPHSDQANVYRSAAAPLLQKFMEGFNATILAYGQTGSGKTHSMGTGLESNVNPDDEGIVPRCIVELFQALQERAQESSDFSYDVYVSFLELYNEELVDLLNPHTAQRRKTQIGTAGAVEVTIREDVAGNIYWSGVREEHCSNPEELLGYLAKGSLCRTTGSTEMNTVSSRSHAVFSVILKQQRPEDDGETKSLTSKFHFVDLAGSERLKRTHAQGDRAREGIAINSGLLALGNVISALGDETRRTSHVPYRDSKLTRLLQDSLGGNSQTLMLACVSPADSNFMETLNTLKYANRARNIKNRVTINQDFAGSSIEVNQLRAQLARLRMEVATLRAEGPIGGAYASTTTHHHQRDDEMRALRSEVTRLRDRIQDLSTNLIQTTSERDTLLMERELGEFLDQDADLPHEAREDAHTKIQTHPIVAQYQKTIQDLNNELSDTRDRLLFLESVKPPPAMHAMADMLPQSRASTPFASLYHESSTVSQRRRNKPRRRGPGGRTSANNSSSTTVRAARVTSKHKARHASLSQSTSLRTKRQKAKAKRQEDVQKEELALNEAQREEVRREVKDSIAKAREEIQNGMQVLELVKPLDDTTHAWEEELRAFELESRQHLEAAAMEDMEEHEMPPVPVWNHLRHLSENSDWSSLPSSEAMTSKDSMSTDAQGSHLMDRTNSNNPQLVRMLHQIQSDIRVKEELVSHLEKSETEYTFLRRKFDDKIGQLQHQLVALQRERDDALLRTKSSFQAKPETAVQLREKQQLIDIRHAYESKTKTLLSEIQELKRRYSQTTTSMQTTRNQNETLLRSLRVNVETLKVEKKRMVKRMRQEAERVREQMSLQHRKIQQLQRLNAEANQARRRLEREHEAQKVTLKRRSEEVLVNSSQLKQLTSVLKKAVREGGVLDERLLGKVSHIIGGSFALVARGAMPRRSGTSSRRKNPVPLQLRVERKKQLLDRALYQFIQGKQAIVEMEQLLFRRERLATEKTELIEERKQMSLADKNNTDAASESMNKTAIEFTDERIDLISAEIAYLSARIRALQSEAAGETTAGCEVASSDASRPEKRVTFADEIVSDPVPCDEWSDMDALEEQYAVPAAAAPEVAFDITVKLLRSFEADECRSIIEALVDDITNIRLSECNRQVTMQNLEKTVQDLRRTLIVMKRAAIATTIENERRIRKLEERDNDKDSAIDVKIEEFINGGHTIFDKIYEDGLRGMINTPEPGLDYPGQQHEGSSGSSVASFGNGSHPEEAMAAQLMATMTGEPAPSSSSSSNASVNANALMRPGTVNALRPPVALTDKNKLGVAGRETTPSPDRFFNMIQKRMSWQQRVGGSESPIPITVVNPAEFARYTTERESSTSSIRSGHLRRSSVHSDYSSSQSQTSAYTTSSSQGSMRKRSASLQQLPLQRRRASLRELSLKGTGGTPMALTGSNGSDHDGSHLPKSSLSFQRHPPQYHPSTSHKRLTLHLNTTLANLSTDYVRERSATPSSSSVFERLAQTPTRASRAKASYRHSSSSMDELRHAWESERAPSALNGAH